MFYYDIELVHIDFVNIFINNLVIGRFSGCFEETTDFAFPPLSHPIRNMKKFRGDTFLSCKLN